ncbi:soluble guanylate cyclase 88E-like [Rhopilema esculentum]|uniref:soluble guanylate cyclase 88E-like n=1 Tax=Rhopilema esculentum TaxID=499914 RepID=UPI0031D9F4C2
MYGLLLESVRFYIKQKYGQDAWEQLCKHTGLKNNVFATADSYSDSIIPRLSESCSKCLPCGLQPDAYMEFFGNCFVDFTSTMGYGKVLKVYGRSFRDFLDNIDSLHEHLRFGYPKLVSPSFECKEETSVGLTLHYRSRRFGYKNYVIGQVKEVAKLYFDLDIDVNLLDEADILTSYGVRRCHIIYRVIFDNSGFMPLVKEHKMLNRHSVPVDLIFRISPFSFLINKDLEIFRASSDLNQYFGENMAGKKVRQIFTLRRPPIELTWDTLVNHGRVIFEFVARQASNISLFTDGNNVESGDLSSRKNDWIEKLKKLERGYNNASDVSRFSKLKSKSVDFTKEKLTERNILQNVTCSSRINAESARNISVGQTPKTIMVQKRAMLKERSSTMDIAVINTEDKILPSRKISPRRSCEWNGKATAECDERLDAHSRTSYPGCVQNEDDNSSGNLIRPEPIGKQHSRDLSPSNTVKCNRMLINGTTDAHDESDRHFASADVWYTSRSMQRPEPIGQEDETKCSMVGMQSVNGPTGSKTDTAAKYKTERTVTTEGNKVKRKQESSLAKRGVVKNARKVSKDVAGPSISNNNNKYKENSSILNKVFQKRKIMNMNISDEALIGRNQEKAFDNKGKRAIGTSNVDASAIQAGLPPPESIEDQATLCSTGLFSSIRRGVGSMRLACFPSLNVRNVKVGTALASTEQQENKSVAQSVPSKKDKGSENAKISSAPLTRKSPAKSTVDVLKEQNMEVKTDPVSRKREQVNRRSVPEKSDTEQKRKRVEMWLQRQQCRPLHLRGQTKYIASWNMVLFIGTPLIGTVDDLLSSGLYLSDLSMHDGSRFLTIQGTQRLSEIEFSCDREKLKRELLKDTTKKLEEEKRRTEELLYSMMPREIAERMKNGDRELTTCETFDDVTILFGYVNDFTKICNKVEAMKVVQLVSEVFSLFDILSENHKVYKFETIGGGVYMLVSGVPVKINEHAREMALMALAMLEKVQTLINPLTNMPLELQIGIHSGPVVAGVIGQATLQYCLFGNTVNIASRMQTTGTKMKIHLSEATNRELQCSEFDTEYRGRVPVKGVGNLNTYWLIGLKGCSKLNVNSSKLLESAEETVR